MADRPCIGSGYCCWKAPCGEMLRLRPDLTSGPCPELRWDGERHLCGLVLDAEPGEQARLKASLAIGGGCSSSLNSWRREPLRDRSSQ